MRHAIGRGILLFDGKGSFAVEPVTSGPVTELLVKQGERVKAGTIIARIRQASLTAQLDGATTRLERCRTTSASRRRPMPSS